MYGQSLADTRDTFNPNLDTALKYLEVGWCVVPCHNPVPGGGCTCKDGRDCDSPGKHPRVKWKHLQKPEHRPTADQIRKWWARWPDANVGIITGAVSGIIVLDVDGEQGQKTLQRENLRVPGTQIAKTGGGGWHYPFRHPGFDCRNFAGKIGKTILPKVDFRGDGGFIVAAPSLHASGDHYEWLVGPDSAEPAEAPAWLLDLIRKQSRSGAGGGRLDPEEWAEEMPEGQRNNEIARRAGSLLARGVPAAEVLTMLLAINEAHCKPPLPDAEVTGIVESIAKAEAGKPKRDFALNWDGAPEVDPDDWPEPVDIEPSLPVVMKLDPALIPAPVRPWVVDVAHRMNAPVDFVAAAVMIVAGSLIGTGCAIQPKRVDSGWRVVPNLWGGVVAGPAQMKSPALNEATKPVVLLEIKHKELHDAAARVADADMEIFKAQQAAVKKRMAKAAATGAAKPGETLDDLRNEYAAMEPPAPAARKRFKTNDVTIEKLADLLSQNPRGVLVIRDELVGLLASWDKPGREPDRAFYLECWNGTGHHTSDRVIRGTSDAPNLCVGLLGAIQPAKLTAYLNQAASPLENDGLVQRLQVLVYPDERPFKLVDEAPDKQARDEAYFALGTLAEVSDFTIAGAEPGNDRPVFVFTDEAQAEFYAWWTALEQMLARESGLPVIVEHLKKYRSLMPSLALIDHVLNVVAGYREPGPVPVESVRVAAGWCEYLESHARRVYSLVGDAGQRAAAELVKKIKTGRVKDGFTLRDVYKNHWYLLDRESVEAACEELIAAGWLRKETKKTGGRPAVTYQINPSVLTE